MQKILIPTDFSPIANNALDYAIEIAAKFESGILLYHVYTFHRKVDFNPDFPEDQQPYVKKIERQMNFTKLKFMEKIKQKGLAIQTKVEEDSIFSLFDRKLKKHDVSLIIMGSKGASGFEKVIFGSVAATALEMAKVPILVVPPNHSFLPIERIVFATDLKDISISILSPLQELAMKFGAKVTILNVNTGSSKNTQRENTLHLEGVETTYQEIPMSKSINDSINEFIDKNKIDLICMVRREKSFFESLFKKSISKLQVYNSKIPLFVLPEN
jgi:nucleotide-binding universal stress UspA family protein